MVTLVSNSLAAPSFWVMARLHPLSLPLDRTLLGWDAGSGLPSQDRQELPHVSSVHTAPVIPPKLKPGASGHSNAHTYSARETPANLRWPSSMTLASLSLPGKQLAIASSLWPT